LIDKQKIIISHHREGKSQRQIERETGINRKTIRKYVGEYDKKKDILVGSKGSENPELIADIVENPKYDTSKRFKVKLTDSIISSIRSYLSENEKRGPQAAPSSRRKDRYPGSPKR